MMHIDGQIGALSARICPDSLQCFVHQLRKFAALDETFSSKPVTRELQAIAVMKDAYSRPMSLALMTNVAESTSNYVD